MIHWNIRYCLCIGALAAFAHVGDGQMLGSAEVIVTNIEQCEDPDQYPERLNLTRHKFNRTTDVYNLETVIGIPWDEKVGLYVNMAKHVDGGYKPNALELNEPYLCGYIMKYYEKGFKECLRAAGLEEKCPIPIGPAKITNYVVDYNQMPDKLLYGDFRGDIYGTLAAERIFCIRVYVTSKPKKASIF